MIKRLFREFFLLTRGEQRGLLAAAVFLFIAIIFRISINFWQQERSAPDYEFMDEALDIYAEIMASKNVAEIIPAPEKIIPEKIVMKLHEFDPNSVTAGELQEMNVPKFPASNLVKFREAGGFFNQPDDLLRIYGLDSALFETLKPYLVFAEQSITPPTDKPVKAEAENLIIDLNRTDSAELSGLPGIGPVLSARIIRYRDLLGGFASLSQLNEVYGLESYDISRISPMVKVDLDMIRKINLNAADYGQLLRHPYLTRNEVSSIIEYRDFTGEIRSPDELYKNIEWDSLRWDKVRVYLDIAENDTAMKKLLQ